MTPVTQSRVGNDGTCFRASLASILDLKEAQVPDFEEANLDPGVDEFLARYGLRYARRDAKGAPPRGWHVIEGLSPRGGQHAVVGRGGRLAHDPHPQDGTGRGLVRADKWGELLPTNEVMPVGDVTYKDTPAANPTGQRTLTRVKNLHRDASIAWNKTGRRTTFAEFVRAVDPSNATEILRYDANKTGTQDRRTRLHKALDANDLSRAAFRKELNEGDYKHSHANNTFGNRKRAYGDYLYHQDRDKFEYDYQEWLAENRRSRLHKALDAVMDKGRKERRK